MLFVSYQSLPWTEMCTFIDENLCIGGNKEVEKIETESFTKNRVWHKLLDAIKI